MDKEFPELAGMNHKQYVQDIIYEEKKERTEFIEKLNDVRTRSGLEPIDKNYAKKWSNLEISAFDEPNSDPPKSN